MSFTNKQAQMVFFFASKRCPFYPCSHFLLCWMSYICTIMSRKILKRILSISKRPVFSISNYLSFSIYSHRRASNFTVTVYCCLFFMTLQLFPFSSIRSVSYAFTDNTSSVLKEKVPKHRGSYVIRHK